MFCFLVQKKKKKEIQRLVWKLTWYSWSLENGANILIFTPQVIFSDIDLKFMQKIGSSGQQNATRCGLWWVEMLKARHQYKDAATVYFRICGEVMLH